MTLLFPYSYSGVFRVGGGRAVNPSNCGSVASTWHLVFALFPFRETWLHSLFTQVYKWVSSTYYYCRVHVIGEFPIQRLVGILLDTSCWRNWVKLRPCGLPTLRLYTPCLACVAIVTVVSFCHLSYLPSFQRRRLNVPACLLESIRKEEMVLPWKNKQTNKKHQGKSIQR